MPSNDVQSSEPSPSSNGRTQNDPKRNRQSSAETTSDDSTSPVVECDKRDDGLESSRNAVGSNWPNAENSSLHNWKLYEIEVVRKSVDSVETMHHVPTEVPTGKLISISSDSSDGNVEYIEAMNPNESAIGSPDTDSPSRGLCYETVDLTRISTGASAADDSVPVGDAENDASKSEALDDSVFINASDDLDESFSTARSSMYSPRNSPIQPPPSPRKPSRSGLNWLEKFGCGKKSAREHSRCSDISADSQTTVKRQSTCSDISTDSPTAVKGKSTWSDISTDSQTIVKGQSTCAASINEQPDDRFGAFSFMFSISSSFQHFSVLQRQQSPMLCCSFISLLKIYIS